MEIKILKAIEIAKKEAQDTGQTGVIWIQGQKQMSHQVIPNKINSILLFIL